MTTAVKVTPANHRIKITKETLDADGLVTNEEAVLLEPNTPEQIFYVHSSLILTVEEVPAEDKAA